MASMHSKLMRSSGPPFPDALEQRNYMRPLGLTGDCVMRVPEQRQQGGDG
ncbi:hypothetical protein [Streptomyces rishiriensis]|uniref:Uncharacterized protein n=1 Tax=Streptomyces rishiriensis TaxID=68264 RepID=A0ABU0NWI5_STRRH|nr:hypothetical protein [Streptomyces rishiriensis]MDQ0583479.1 hypothetical protein [Streptomyces rishiriensis]